MIFVLLGDGICNIELLTEDCCFDMGDCNYKSNSSSLCTTCGLKDSDSLIANKECDGFLLHVSCCFDGGDCGCPTCPVEQDAIGDDMCDFELDTDECCYDGGDCRCREVTSPLNECCPESDWCFPPNSLCPTCSLDLVQHLTNGKCDSEFQSDPNCCFDDVECELFQLHRDYLIDGARYRIEVD